MSEIYYSKLPPEIILQHIEQGQELWGNKRSESERTNHLIQLLNDNYGSFFMSGLVDDHGILIASLKRYYYPLNFRGDTMMCVGLGAVLTNPKYRRRGMAERLIRRVLNESHSQFNCSMAMLYSDIGIEYYQKFGFLPLPSYEWRLAVSDIVPSSDLSIKPLQISENSEWQSVLTLHQQALLEAIISIYPVRSRNSWNLFSRVNWVDEQYILHDQGKIAGWICFSRGDTRGTSYLRVKEAFVCQQQRENLWSTLATIARNQGLNELRGWHTPFIYQVPKLHLMPRSTSVAMLASLDNTLKLSDHEIQNSHFTELDHF